MHQWAMRMTLWLLNGTLTSRCATVAASAALLSFVYACGSTVEAAVALLAAGPAPARPLKWGVVSEKSMPTEHVVAALHGGGKRWIAETVSELSGRHAVSCVRFWAKLCEQTNEHDDESE